MTLLRNFTLTLLAATSLTACTLAPTTVRPTLPVAQTWPTPQVETAASAADLASIRTAIEAAVRGQASA